MSVPPDNDDEKMARPEASRDQPAALERAPAASAPEPARPPAVTLAAALDQLAHPMLALQPDALLLHANLAGRELLAQGWPLLRGSDGRVQAQQTAQRSPFILAVLAAAAGSSQGLHWVDGPRSLHSVLRPLEPGGASPSPVLLVLTPPAETIFDVGGFASTHQLSKAETRVLEALLHGHQADEAAQRLGVGVATVRSQIAAIRKKSGHGSVASLLAALGDLPPLRRSGPAEGK